MAGLCPAPGPEEPLVRSLLGTVDCNVQGLVYGGYSALFQTGSPFATLLTTLLTIFVALFGFALMTGRAQLRISNLALTLVKIGAVLALTTQWSTYQAVVYDFLFDGPQQLANAMLSVVRADGTTGAGGVFDGLQLAFDQMNTQAAEYARRAPATASPLLGGAGFGALALTMSASILLFSSLGVLLAAKIVLGVLLAIGPVFIALLLFDSTRGLFEGWLRAALAFAFAPLAATLLLGVALTMLEPSLVQLREAQAQNLAALGPVYSVLTLVLVFAGVSAGVLVAGGMIAGGLRLPQRVDAAPGADERAGTASTENAVLNQPRAERIAAAAAALDRRESAVTAGAGSTFNAAGAGASGDRRISVAVGSDRSAGPAAQASIAGEPRLGQAPRRSARPRTIRAGGRRAR